MGLLKRGVYTLAALAAMAGAAFADPIITDQGPVAGVVKGEVVSFKGLPYAAPPVGDLRWRPPQAPQPWTAPRLADTFGAPCPQTPLSGRALIMSGGDPAPSSEDCLTLNIWAPVARAEKPRPVMVWLYGGSLKMGSGSIPWYDGTHFAEDGVVLVTMNYRLGPLGWLAHPALVKEARAKGEAFGDYGLMDQIAALKWVQRNIAAFGGDPTNVTIFGESAGGFSVLMLMSSEASQGLFAKAIVESGGGGYAMPLRVAEEKGAKALGADLTPQQLRALPLDQVNRLDDAAASGELIDGTLLREAPATTVMMGKAAKVPLLIGSNSGEDSLMAEYPDSQAHTLGFITPDRLDAVKAAYGPEAATDVRFAHALFTDLHMGAPAHDFAAAQSTQAPAYLYQFDYVPEAIKALLPKAVHGMEIFFVFKTQEAAPIRVKPSDADVATADLMHRCWVAFARLGKPECGVDWAPFDPARNATFYVDKTPRQVTDFRKAQYQALAGVWPVW